MIRFVNFRARVLIYAAGLDLNQLTATTSRSPKYQFFDNFIIRMLTPGAIDTRTRSSVSIPNHRGGLSSCRRHNR